MAVYRFGSVDDLLGLARRRGWVLGSGAEDGGLNVALPAVGFHGADGKGRLLERTVHLRAPVQLALPDVRVHGRNLALFVEDKVFPGGFAHSFWPSPAWQAVAPGQWRHAAREVIQLDAPMAHLLGVTSHFGHFFVDALERFLRLAPVADEDAAPWLVGAPELLGLQPDMGERATVPQVAQLVELMGHAALLPRLQPVPLGADLQVRELRMWALRASKPAIPVDAMLAVRERLATLLEPAWRAAVVSSSRGLFVAREAVRKRFILDQGKLLSVLSEDFGLDIVMPEHLRMTRAIERFATASAVLLPIGSAKFNLLCCRPGTPVVCITPKGYARQDGGVVLMVRHLCHALGLPLAFYDVEIQRCEPLLNSNLVIGVRDIDPMLDLVDALRHQGGSM